MRSALNTQVLESIERGTGFLQRLRLITPSNLVPSLIGAMGSGRVESLADLHRHFNDDASTDVAEKSFYDRLDEPSTIVVMDNAGANKARRVLDCLASAGHLMRLLPPNSPELNPVGAKL